MIHAVQFPERERAALVTLDDDEAPLGPREVRGQTRASLISAGTELAAGFLGSHFPGWPGYAAVFDVTEAGAEVTHLAPGDRAFCMGPHRSHQRVAAENAVKIPDGLDPKTAVLARLMMVSMSTLTTTTARPPQPVLVTGLGLVGQLAARVFFACGYRVGGVDPDGARRAFAQSAGIATFPAVPQGDPAWQDRVALVVDCSGREAAVRDACRIVAKRGEVVMIGTPWTRHPEIVAHDILHAVFHRYVVLRSGWEWEVPLHRTDFRPGSLFDNLAGALDWLASGRVRGDDLTTSVSPADCQAAYESLRALTSPRPGIVFDWTALG